MWSKTKGREWLSMSEIFREPYHNITIEQLQEHYQLEIERFNLGLYRYYTPQQLLWHYNIEVELARRLMNSSKTDRKTLYSSLYEELFRRVPYHSQLLRKSDSASKFEAVRKAVASFERYLRPDCTFLEIGAGDCQLSFEVARRVKKVYAIDVSEEITKNTRVPNKFELILSDGSSVNVEPKSIDVAYSNQLMEHLHPEDAITQLEAIHKALVPSGIYICITPHRFGGPADVSRFFDNVARGLHLKEYTNSELHRLFSAAGFSRISTLKRIGDKYVNFPLLPALALEVIINPLPHSWRKKIYNMFQQVLNIRLVAQK